MVTADQIEGFIRLVYQQSNPKAFLNDLNAAALKVALSGKTLTGSTGDSFAAQYLVLQAWTPADASKLIRIAFRYLESGLSLEEALEQLNAGGYTLVRTNYHQLRTA